jgi:hypothetical protein
MPRIRKPPKAALSAAPTVVAEPRPTPVRPVDASSPSGTPLLIWLDAETDNAFRVDALAARIPLERFVALHLRTCAMPPSV